MDIMVSREKLVSKIFEKQMKNILTKEFSASPKKGDMINFEPSEFYCRRFC